MLLFRMACQCLGQLLSLTPKEKESLQCKILPDESLRKETLLKTIHLSPSGQQKVDTAVQSVVIEGISITQYFKKDVSKVAPIMIQDVFICANFPLIQFDFNTFRKENWNYWEW